MLFFSVAACRLEAQSVSAATDRNQILIGERIEYELTLNLPSPGYSINVKLPDTIPHFDLIENGNFDTVSSNGSYLLKKKIVFTSFDSGLWHIPSFDIMLEKNTVTSKLSTDSLLVNVGYSPADSTNQLRDIKPVIDVTVTDYTWLYITGAVLGALLIIILLYRYFRNRKNKPKPVFHSSLSPYDEAMQALHSLKTYELDKPEQVKAFHVQLAEIFKKYYSRKENKDLLSKTTSEILVSVKEQNNDPALLSALAAGLRSADAVKFAKYIPAPAESGESLDRIKASIDLIENKQS